MWHHHQPLYKDSSSTSAKGRYLQPWVRLHALRDYYSMAALAAEYPSVHLTINLTPVLLSQLEDYVVNSSIDEALELTLKPAEKLAAGEREQLLSTFFDASWHHQIFCHARYRELFSQRSARQSFSEQDLRDLQAWFSLAWFGREFREGTVCLTTGEQASVERYIRQARGFTLSDIRSIVAEQYKIMRAIVPIHRALEERGQIELSTTPFYHPILPLLVDTDRATIDRASGAHPERFARPEDASAQVGLAKSHHQRWFRRPPAGMWPAEGAVAQLVIPMLAAHGTRWIASDRGVLARSGRWGYRADDPSVLARAYRGEQDGSKLAVFFRDPELSDDIGFRCHREADQARAARSWVARLKQRFGGDGHEDERIVTVVLDGENAWGSYADDGRPFLRALYEALSEDLEVATVTFSEYLHGDPGRNVRPHAVESLEQVHELFTGSWIDEAGSQPGIDLGTWIGEPEENRAWELLRRARDDIEKAERDAPPVQRAHEAVLAAEGSDWFWWFGSDQDSGHDAEFDALFRLHLTNAYRALNAPVPADLAQPVVREPRVWTFPRQVTNIGAHERLTIRTNCPGVLTWSVDEGPTQEQALHPVGGVMAGATRHELTLSGFGESARLVRFRFRCTHEGCTRGHPCCKGDEQRVQIVPSG